jgi:hypothetical protein
MNRTDTAVRVGGGYLAAASVLMIAALALHGPIAPDLSEQMTRIAEAPNAWIVAHWLAAAALSFYVVAGLLILTSGSRLVEGAWPMGAWTVLTVGAFWVLTTAIAEATAVTRAAVAGNTLLFEMWWSFAEGHANGVVVMALAVAVIASREARSEDPIMAPWAARAGAIAAIASPVGWAAGMWLGVRVGGLVWLAATVLMTAWTLWFAIALMRRRPATATHSHRPAAAVLEEAT